MERAKQRIIDYLNSIAETDSVFAEKMKDEKKSIDDCIDFISAQVQKISSGKAAMIDDDTVFNLAAHYYDEVNISEERVNASIVYAGAITDEERAQMQEEAKQTALQFMIAEQKDKIKASAKARADRVKKEKEEAEKKQEQEQQQVQQQLSLF